MKRIEIDPTKILWYMSVFDEEVDKEISTTLGHGDPSSGISPLGATQVSLDTCTGRVLHLYCPPEHMLKYMLGAKKYDKKFWLYIKEEDVNIGCRITPEAAKMLLRVTSADEASVTYSDLIKSMVDAREQHYAERIVFAAQDIDAEEMKKAKIIRLDKKFSGRVFRTRSLVSLRENYDSRVRTKDLKGFDFAAFKLLRINNFHILLRKRKGKYKFIIQFWSKPKLQIQQKIPA